MFAFGFSDISFLYFLRGLSLIHIFAAMNTAIAYAVTDTRLKQMRENRGLSQSELAEKSGVKLRSIQMYEQRVNDIDKAQSQTLFKLSRVLGCKIEDLLENPNM